MDINSIQTFEAGIIANISKYVVDSRNIWSVQSAFQSNRIQGKEITFVPEERQFNEFTISLL